MEGVTKGKTKMLLCGLGALLCGLIAVQVLAQDTK